MKPETAMGIITPGSLETANWKRDPSTWRRSFLLTHLTPKLDGLTDDEAEATALRAHWNGAADALEQHFNGMQTFKSVIRGEGLKRYEAVGRLPGASNDGR